MKKIIGVVCVLITLGFSWYFFGDGKGLGSLKEQIIQEAQDAAISGANPDDVATLAMKAITLTQGEQGVELWRLKADWGNVRRKDSVMELEKPNFTYYTSPDNKPITIVAEKGEIEQEEQRIRFVNSVVATYEGRTLHAAEILYLGKSRELVCPQGGEVKGEGYEGSASRTIVWFIKEQILESVGDITVMFENDLFTPQPETPESLPEAPRSSLVGTQG